MDRRTKTTTSLRDGMSGSEFAHKNPAFFRVMGEKILYLDSLSQTLFSLNKGVSTPVKTELATPFHPLFYSGSPFAVVNNQIVTDNSLVFLEGGKNSAFGMDLRHIYKIEGGEKTEISRSLNTLLGFCVCHNEKRFLIHETVSGASFYEKSALILWDETKKTKTTLYCGDSLVTHYGFQSDNTPFFLTETNPIVLAHGLDGFKRRALGAKNIVFFKDRIFALFSCEGEDGLYEWQGSKTTKIPLPLASIQEIFADLSHLYIAGLTVNGHFKLLQSKIRNSEPLDFKNGNTFSERALFAGEPLEAHMGKGWLFGGFHPNKPILIRIHGGPIGHMEKILSPETRFYLERGFQVICVNYRGSTGYGRGHRVALLKNYGKADVEDVVCLIKELKKKGVITSNIFLKGKSSAGLTAILSSLEEEVQALAIYCPVTHNDPLDAELASLFPHNYDPFEKMCTNQTPMILFQGDMDRIVAKEHTDKYVKSLNASRFFFQYEILEGVGHSIKGETEMECLEKEIAFFKKS
jgi:hypothetical protein